VFDERTDGARGAGDVRLLVPAWATERARALLDAPAPTPPPAPFSSPLAPVSERRGPADRRFAVALLIVWLAAGLAAALFVATVMR
jgi:hypothetical protein